MLTQALMTERGRGREGDKILTSGVVGGKIQLQIWANNFEWTQTN